MKATDIKNFQGACGIYIIRNLKNQHIYVGQTSRLFRERWREHIYAPITNSGGEGHTPLHQAILKYGISNFDFDVLEYCSIEELDEREQYWIRILHSNDHNNYNQTLGGNNSNLQPNLPNFVLQVIDDLKNTNLNQKEIAQKYNITANVVSNINRGIHYVIPTCQYPIRSLTFNIQKLADIILQYPEISLTQLAVQYKTSLSTLKRINKGEGNYHLDGYTYPLRKPKDIDYNTIIDLLANTTQSLASIARQCNVSASLVSKINTGERYYLEGIDYPIRK